MTLPKRIHRAGVPLQFLIVLVLILILCILSPACSMMGHGGLDAEGRPDGIGMGEAESLAYRQNVDELAWGRDRAQTPTPGADSLGLEIERLIDAVRRKHGQEPLEVDQELRKIALRHSRDMLKRNYVGHVSLEGMGPGQRVRKQYRRMFGLTAENVALVDSPPKAVTVVAGEFVDEWMNSPRHRQNILSSEFNRMAVGCCQVRTGRMDQRRCTQLFATEYALAEQDVPETVDVGQTVSLRIRALQGFPSPCRVLQTDAASQREVSSVPLAGTRGAAEGRIAFRGPPGGYILKIYVPNAKGAEEGVESFLVIPGPYVIVK